MSFRWPLNNVDISRGFGSEPAYYKQFGQLGHNGIDLAAPAGTPIYAADEGTIAFEGVGKSGVAGFAGWFGDPAGICILINHVGSYAGYAHLSRTVVDKGQRVSKGQLIGYVGSTGTATGPHLHFEMLPLSPNFSNGYAGRISPLPFMDQSVTTATESEIRQAYQQVLERPADPGAISHYKAYSLDFVIRDLMASSEKRDLDARKAEAARVAADQAAAQAAALVEEARKASEAKTALEAAQKAEAERAAAEAELARIAEEERIAREKAEKKATEQKAIEDALKGQLMTTTQEDIKKLAEAVNDSEVVASLVSKVSPKTKLIIYIVGDTLLGLGILVPSIFVIATNPDMFVKATALSTALASAGGFLLTMFGIFKSGTNK